MMYEGLIGSNLVNTVVVCKDNMKMLEVMSGSVSWCELKAMRKGNSVIVE